MNSKIDFENTIENLSFERKLWNSGMRFIAGVDEAGRGPLAGPVVAAALIFPRNLKLDGIKDSKTLSSKKRYELYELIKSKAISIGIGIVDNKVIDEINILNATFRAMHKAIEELIPTPDYLLVDGPYFAELNIPAQKIVNGDSRCYTIAAASIVAKIVRDDIMIKYDQQYPDYGFARNKGYGTREHIEAIKKFGLTDLHRKSYKLHKL